MNQEPNDVILKGIVDDILAKYLQFFKDKKLKDISFNLVEKEYLKGLESGEVQFNMNFVPNYQTLSFIQNFAFNNVTKLNEDLKDALRKEISLGLMNRETVPMLSKRIQEVLNSTIERAKLITVTETNRAFNVGHYQAAKESGLNVVKEWNAQPERNEDNPCPICQEMDGKQIRMDGKFYFSNGESVFLPPLHPRCKCRVIYVQKE